MVNVYSTYNQLDPAQAMYVNGKYLEQVVTGYRTLKVEGREPLSLDTENIEISTRDGARYKRRRILPRTITIYFTLIANSATTFESRFDTLKGYLYKIEESQITFDDEPNVYYTGTYKDVKINRYGTAAEGTITIECADPFKYSKTSTTVLSQLVDGDIVLKANYAGTYEAHPVIEATCTSDNGFYGFVNDAGAILQFGDPEEADTVPASRSETLINDSFATIPSGWSLNDSGVLGSSGQVGSFGTGRTHSTKGNGIDPALGSYGTGLGWHGPSLTKAVPADSQSATGAANFRLSANVCMFAYRANETGIMAIYIAAENNGNKFVLAGIDMMDGSAQSFGTQLRLQVNGQIVKKISTTTRHDNPYTGLYTGELAISKSGATITFEVGTEKWSFSDDAWTNIKAEEITLYAAVYADTAEILQNGFYSLKFRKDFVSYTDDVPNKYMPGDALSVDTSDGTITVNDSPRPELGEAGNQWEEFTLVPGNNTVVCSASSWVSTASYKMRYREVYL